MQTNPVKKEKILKILRIFSIIIFTAMFILCIIFFKDATVKDIMNYTPHNYFLSFLVMILLYSAKSFSIVFSIKILFLACSRIYPFWLAIIINTIGTGFTVSIPYFIGKYLGKDYANKLITKYPKIKELNEITNSNSFLFTLSIKAFPFFPGDITSIFLGASGVSYPIYLLASIIGIEPDMISITILGESIYKNNTLCFIALVINILLAIFSVLIINYLIKKHKAKKILNNTRTISFYKLDK